MYNDIEIVKNSSDYPFGIGMNCTKILSFTTERLIEVIGPIQETDYPLNIEIADGLDGSGSHKVYNQVNSHISFSTKSFTIFAFKILTIKDKRSKILWLNDAELHAGRAGPQSRGLPTGAGRVLLSACGLCGPSFFVAGLRPASSPQQARTISDSTEFIIYEWKIFTRY